MAIDCHRRFGIQFQASAKGIKSEGQGTGSGIRVINRDGINARQGDHHATGRGQKPDRQGEHGWVVDGIDIGLNERGIR